MLRPSAGETLRAWLLSALVVHGAVAGNPDAKRLYDDLLSNYNKLVRPVVNTSDVLRVCIKLKLSQLIDVLSSKTGLSNGFSELRDLKSKKSLKSERDILPFWDNDSKMMAGLDRSEMGVCHLCPYASYLESYEGIHPSIVHSFISKDLEEKYKKMEMEERYRKSKLISSSLKEESRSRKNSSSRYIFKSRRKSHKFNRPETCSKKFKHPDSMKKVKKVLENCKIINEDFDKSSTDSLKESKHVPTYFILKLSRNAGKNLIKKEEAILERTQSLKLIFANDDPQNDSEEKSKGCFLSSKSSYGAKLKGEFNQTTDNNDKFTKKTHFEDSEIKCKENAAEVKHCLQCIKMVENFKLQREFNSELLEQIKRMVSNLTTMTGLFNDLINSKIESNKNINNKKVTEDISQDFSKIENSREKIFSELDFETATDIAVPCPLHSNSSQLGDSTTEYSEYWKFLKNDFENISKDVWTIFTQRKRKDVFFLPQAESEPIVEAHIRKKNESSAFDVNSKCHCQTKNSCADGKKMINRTKRNKRELFKKRLLEKYENINLQPEGGDQKIIKKDLYKEEDGNPDDDDTGDEMEKVYRNAEVELEVITKKIAKKKNTGRTRRMKKLDKDQVGLSLDENDCESNGQNFFTYINECSAEQISSRGSSRANLKNQIMTTNLWVEQSWYDYKLRWDPKEYGGVHMLHVPSDHIWRPDIVLYNNADGNFEVTLATKATIYHQGLVEWKPPAIYKSSCEIDVEYFPFDEQTCVLKFGSWTYDGFKVDLRHMDEKAGSNVVEVGVDLSEFYMSVEWDILEVPAVRNEKFYTCCDEPYLDITFNITMRRKTLFYTVNIIIPCMGISFLTVLTFYLPSDSGEKVTLSISILISLHVFFLLVVEIIPPTSLVVPLLGKYLIFAMILVSISICVTVVVLNVHFRSPQTHRMAPWVKRVFIHILPRLLVMRRPQYHFEPHRFMSRRVIMQTVKGKEVQTSYYPYPYQASAPAENPKVRDGDCILTRQRTLSKEDFSPESLADGEPVFGGSCQIHGPPPQSESEELSLSGVEGGVDGGEDLKSPTINNPAFSHSLCPPEVHKSCFCVRFIAEHTKMLEDSTKVKEDWKYVAMVLDRLFLWIFTLAVLVGTAGIILQAPTLYDDRIPIDKQFAEIQTSTVIRCPPQ